VASLEDTTSAFIYCVWFLVALGIKFLSYSSAIIGWTSFMKWNALGKAILLEVFVNSTFASVLYRILRTFTEKTPVLVFSQNKRVLEC